MLGSPSSVGSYTKMAVWKLVDTTGVQKNPFHTYN